MKLSISWFLCICTSLMSSYPVDSATSTVPSTGPTISTISNGASSTAHSTSPTGSTGSTSASTGSISASTGSSPALTSLSSSMASSTEGNNSTSISSTAQSTTTTQTILFCKNGTCADNDSSCLNETVTDTCMLSASESCYQIVYKNDTDTYYEVGCSSSCEFLVEETDSVTKTTRCCDTDMCNNELLSDPDQGNKAAQIPVPFFLIVLLVYSNWLFN